MSNLRKALDSLNVGDIIETRRTSKVTKTDPEYVRIEDVHSGYEFYIGKGVSHGSLKVNMVKTVKRAAPAYRIGDMVRLAEVKQGVLPTGSLVRRPGYPPIEISDDDPFFYEVDEYVPWDQAYAYENSDLLEVLHVANAA